MDIDLDTEVPEEDSQDECRIVQVVTVTEKNESPRLFDDAELAASYMDSQDFDVLAEEHRRGILVLDNLERLELQEMLLSGSPPTPTASSQTTSLSSNWTNSTRLDEISSQSLSQSSSVILLTPERNSQSPGGNENGVGFDYVPIPRVDNIKAAKRNKKYRPRILNRHRLDRPTPLIRGNDHDQSQRSNNNVGSQLIYASGSPIPADGPFPDQLQETPTTPGGVPIVFSSPVRDLKDDPTFYETPKSSKPARCYVPRRIRFPSGSRMYTQQESDVVSDACAMS